MPTLMSQEQPSNGFGRALDALALGSFEVRELAPLSDLSLANRREFEAAWLQLSDATRVQAIRKINELAAASFEFLPHRVLESAIRRDPSAVVRQLAIVGSYERGDEVYFRLLLDLIDSDPSVDVRAAAAAGLANACDLAVFGGNDGIEELGPEIRDRLRALIENPGEHPLVRGGAIESVAAFGTDAFVTGAIHEAVESDDDGLRASALIAMGRTCDRQWLGELLEALRSEDSQIRVAAAIACGRLGEPDALVSLGTIARDHVREVRHAAIRSIGEIGGDAASTILKRVRAGASEEESELIDSALADASLTQLPETDEW